MKCTINFFYFHNNNVRQLYIMYFIDCQTNMDTINILFYCLKKINVLIYVLINFIDQNKFGVTKFLNIFYWPIKI